MEGRCCEEELGYGLQLSRELQRQQPVGEEQDLAQEQSSFAAKRSIVLRDNCDECLALGQPIDTSSLCIALRQGYQIR